jgi:formylglycine-generating enzyme required for sulfatase activity
MNTPQCITWERDNKEMIFIPGGTFMMGCNEGSAKHRPSHPVEVAPFYIDRFPVTNRDYERFIRETEHPIPHYEVSWCDTRGYNWDPQTQMYPEDKADHPVVLVTWQDALAYANWAGKRLPTEAEWELAARGLACRVWPWGDKPLAEHSNTSEAGAGSTTPVGSFSPNGDTPEGVADLIGNVWEWTSTLFRPYPYDPNDGRERVKVPGWRVLRGGSWTNDLYIARGYSRLDGDFVLYNNVGFRCAASLPAPGEAAEAQPD